MAIRPCDRCGSRYRGASQAAYPALLKGTYALRAHLRLCPDCALIYQAYLVEHLVDALADELPSTCLACNAVDTSFAVFVTVYFTSSDRHDMYGRACQDCVNTGELDVLFATQRPSTATAGGLSPNGRAD